MEILPIPRMVLGSFIAITKKSTIHMFVYLSMGQIRYAIIRIIIED